MFDAAGVAGRWAHAARTVLASVFGVWTAPAWMGWCAQRIRAAVLALVQRVRARPVLSASLAAAVLLVAGGGYGGYRWWKAQPRPEAASFQVSGPALTNFADNGEPQDVTVSFDRSVAPLKQAGKEVAAGIDLSPRVEGKWQWVGDNRLVFTPAQEWPVGAAYEVTLQRTVVAPHLRLDRYDFKFSSAAFAASIRKAEFHQDPVDPARKKAVIELGFSHPVN